MKRGRGRSCKNTLGRNLPSFFPRLHLPKAEFNRLLLQPLTTDLKNPRFLRHSWIGFSKQLNIDGQNSLSRTPATALWFRLYLPSFGPGFKSQAPIYAFFNLYCWNLICVGCWNEKWTKINEKEAGIGPLFKNISLSHLPLLFYLKMCDRLNLLSQQGWNDSKLRIYTVPQKRIRALINIVWDCLNVIFLFLLMQSSHSFVQKMQGRTSMHSVNVVIVVIVNGLH